jgi:hypothetical protein
MWPFIRPINLIRYLIVWKINSSLVVLPRYFAPLLSRVLSTMIGNRLPTHEARDWRKALAAWDDETTAPSEARWPIEAILFPYPSKRSYGRGEVILWELKLVGSSADHGLFLELILPAMEEAASTSDSRWRRPNRLWGEFDVQAVYAARGTRWEPVVRDGRLDLDYRASPAQWAEGLTFGQDAKRQFRDLTWITPFDLGEMPDALDSSHRSRTKIEIPVREVPTIQGILDALISRMTLFLPDKNPTPDDVLALLDVQEQEALQHALEKARRISRRQILSLESAPKGCPGCWVGTQTFAGAIPSPLLPYLELAAILHVGKQTHFGCGTFRLFRPRW